MLFSDTISDYSVVTFTNKPKPLAKQCRQQYNICRRRHE